jgi:hypothetical protein
MAVAPIRNPIRASRTSADDVEGVSMVYSISLPGVLLRIQNGAVSGWVSRYGGGPREGAGGVPSGSSSVDGGCGLHVERPAVSRAASTGRIEGWRRACSAAKV